MRRSVAIVAALPHSSASSFRPLPAPRTCRARLTRVSRVGSSVRTRWWRRAPNCGTRGQPGRLISAADSQPDANGVNLFNFASPATIAATTYKYDGQLSYDMKHSGADSGAGRRIFDGTGNYHQFLPATPSRRQRRGHSYSVTINEGSERLEYARTVRAPATAGELEAGPERSDGGRNRRRPRLRNNRLHRKHRQRSLPRPRPRRRRGWSDGRQRPVPGAGGSGGEQRLSASAPPVVKCRGLIATKVGTGAAETIIGDTGAATSSPASAVATPSAASAATTSSAPATAPTSSSPVGAMMRSGAEPATTRSTAAPVATS